MLKKKHIIMKTIKTIFAALFLMAGTAAQAQQVMTVKTARNNDKFQLTSRLVLDLTGQRPIVRTNSQSMAYKAGEHMLMYLMPTADDVCQIIDGVASFYNPEDRFYKQITYTRDFQNRDWQLLYLPLRLEFDQWGDDFDIARINDVHQYDTDQDGRIDETELEVVMVRNGYTEPNTPYVIRAHSTGMKTIVQNGATLYASEQTEKTVSSWNTDFTIRGTYSTIPAGDMPSGSYYAMESNSLGMASSDGQLNAFRWYVTATSRNSSAAPDIKRIRIREFSTDQDGIDLAPATPEEEGTLYDISGRRVSAEANSSLKTGIYIRGGKKIAVK